MGQMAEDEMPHLPDPPPAPGGGGSGVRPGQMFRWGVYVSLGVLAVLAAAAAVYTTRAVLVRVLIALFIAVSLDPAVRALTRRVTRRLLGAMYDTLTLLVLTIYFVGAVARLRPGAVLLFPRARRADAGRVADGMVDKVGSYMLGNLLISLAAGLASCAVLAALGV